MSTALHITKAGNLLSAVEAVRNWRAVLLMFAAILIGGLLFGLGGVVSMKVHPALGALFFLVGLAAFFYGGNAVGVMMMDEARGFQARSPMAAVLESLATGHRLILAFLTFSLIYVFGLLAIALLLLICKIPGIGPFLFTFVFPAAIVVTGMAIFALQMVVFPLTAPAVWSGATAMQAVARVGAIARAKVIPVVLMMIVLTLIVVAVGGIIGAILFTGTMVTGGLAAVILDAGSSFGGLPGLFDLVNAGGRDGGGYVVAGSLGGGIVYAVGFSLTALVFSRGCCNVYLANLEGVDVNAMEAAIQNKLDETRRRAEEMRANGAALQPQAQASSAQPAPEAPIATAPVAAAPDLQCPQCKAPHQRGDLFCGECGFKLQS